MAAKCTRFGLLIPLMFGGRLSTICSTQGRFAFSARTAPAPDPTMLNRLTDTLEFHGQALGLRSERQRLLASNIANADTPGYVARDVDFSLALRDATSSIGSNRGASGLAMPTGAALASPRGALATTASNHMAGTVQGLGSGGLRDRLTYATAAQTNLDGNTVDMDRERANFADNAVKYEATLRFINGNVRTMLDAIKGQS
jgi:flagellar basal-body rod protein FlgB